MTEIVDLDPNEEPPKRGDWLLVCRNEQAHYVTICSTAHQLRESNFFVPVPEPDPDIEAATARAMAWAERHRFARVFVRG